MVILSKGNNTSTTQLSGRTLDVIAKELEELASKYDTVTFIDEQDRKGFYIDIVNLTNGDQFIKVCMSDMGNQWYQSKKVSVRDLLNDIAGEFQRNGY